MKYGLRSWSVNWRIPASVLLLMLTLSLPVGRGMVAPARGLAAEPVLLQIAAQHPRAMVGVIVERLGHDGAAARLVVRLGGHVTKNLSIINAFAAVLPAHALPTLASAPGVRWVSLDAAVVKTDTGTSCSTSCPVTSTVQSTFISAIGADQVWASNGDQGQGIGVAVVDSGVNDMPDLDTSGGASRIVAATSTISGTSATSDDYGHGTHVAGIIAGNGAASNGAYPGVAPQANLINVRVSDDTGQGVLSDVVNGLQWVYNNAATYNIRVVNLSLNSTVPDSYNVDPLDAACEVLWQHGIVVVVSAGNNATAMPGAVFPPANDPFVITVGAVDDKGTTTVSDDTRATFSAFGTTQDGYAKPDLVAPGVNIISLLAGSSDGLATAHPANVVNASYFMMSGTSMAAPVVAGTVALLLQAQPSLTPDQVKYRLMSTAQPLGPGTGAGEVNASAAVTGTSTTSANVGVPASQLLTSNPTNSASSPANWSSASWGSASWSSASWTSASWGSASWGSASWSSVSWSSDYWGNGAARIHIRGHQRGQWVTPSFQSPPAGGPRH